MSDRRRPFFTIKFYSKEKQNLILQNYEKY